jgi:RsiW-degrading membrane proteinase PrsW (M82 family)
MKRSDPRSPSEATERLADDALNGSQLACGEKPKGKTLSWLSYFFLALVAVAFIAVIAIDWTNVLVIPLALLPPLAIGWFAYAKWLRKVAQQDDAFVRMFFGGFLPGALFCLLVEAALSLLFALICLNDQLNNIMQQIARDPQGGAVAKNINSMQQTVGFYFFVLLTSYITAAAVEEITKAAVVRMSCFPCLGPEAALCVQRRRSYSSPRTLAYATLALLLAASLGFSVAENILYIFAESFANPGKANLSHVGGKAMIAVVRGIVSMPVHCVCVAFTALRLTLRDSQKARQEELDGIAADGGLYRFVHDHSTDGSHTGAESELAHMRGVDAAVGGVPEPLRVAVQQPDLERRSAVPAPVEQLPGSLQRAAGNPFMQPAPANGRWELVYSPTAASAAADRIVVWSWPRVLWPAIALHGTFDFQALLISAVFTRTFGDALVTSLTLLVGVFMLVFALWVLIEQYDNVLSAIARGDTPTRITGRSLLTCLLGERPCSAVAAMLCCTGRRKGGNAFESLDKHDDDGDGTSHRDVDGGAETGAASHGGHEGRPQASGSASRQPVSP